MSRVEERIARIREQIPIVAVLSHYGYRVREDGGEREQQFPCDLHGDGQDNSPSARAYDDHFYCFGCGVSRDAIDLVQAKEGCTFGQACRTLESLYGLPSLPWGDEDEHYKPPPSAREEIEKALTQEVPFEAWGKRLSTLLMTLTQERTLTMKPAMRFWESFDKVCHRVREEEMSESLGSKALEKLRGQIMDELKGGAGA